MPSDALDNLAIGEQPATRSRKMGRQHVRRLCLDEESGNSCRGLFTIMFVQNRQRDRQYSSV